MSKTRRWVLMSALTLAIGVPAQAAGTVALLPAPVVKGAPANGRVATQALQAALVQEGFRLVPASRVESTLRSQRVNPRSIIPIGTLSRIRAATGADYVIYPRVLSVGVGVNSNQYQATILVNVVGKNGRSFLHTRQVGQPFVSDTGDAARAVLSAEDAGEAADKLLEGFFAKAR